MIIWEVDCIYIILMLCGNTVIGQFIHEKDLKWIPYCGFENIKYLDKGGFGIVYKATWLENKKEVVLKCLNQLKSNMDLDEFLNEWKYHCQVINSNAIINVYGITKDPDTSKHMMIFKYLRKREIT
ncbi:kinase-like domain-containing protein [Rhizophagus clarus]|uniref:Kinase-like domain-containing protein n=1 Tax=Rhizophagus clarus TaxID=94130 RepID=A0A8H3QSP6_9GLOM|nr:kinase-like domain-containing protein [Rhizophagus clarus]